MIVFDLRCGQGHVFEAWFASGGAYDEQRAAGQVRCPLCDDAAIEKAVMAPAIPSKGNSRPEMTPAAVKAALGALAAAQKNALDQSTWVGGAFATEARAMHAGDKAEAPIHGRASLKEARALAEEGVPIAPLPFPVVPPDAVN